MSGYKLVRDKVPDQIKEGGFKKSGYALVDDIASGDNLKKALLMKLLEESLEVHEAKDSSELIEEMADVLEVLHSICQVNEIQFKQVQEMRMQKRLDKGGFLEGKLLKFFNEP